MSKSMVQLSVENFHFVKPGLIKHVFWMDGARRSCMPSCTNIAETCLQSLRVFFEVLNEPGHWSIVFVLKCEVLLTTRAIVCFFGARN